MRGCTRPAFAAFAMTGLALFAVVERSSGQAVAPPKFPANRPVQFQPYTVELRITTLRTHADGTNDVQENDEIMAQDSQGRSLFANTNLKTGFSAYTVNDPVSGVRILWNTQNTQAKMLKFPEPVPERKSCWEIAPEELHYQQGDVQIGLRGTTCWPAGQHQPPNCRQPRDETNAMAWKSTEDPRASAASYADCVRALESVILDGTTSEEDQDLGTERIQGFETHCCRVTRMVPGGAIVRESWMTKIGSQRDSAILALRSMDDRPLLLAGMLTLKQSTELTNLDLREPDLSIFQPPRDYEIKTVEMHEVPCGQQRPHSALPAPWPPSVYTE